MNKTNTIVAMSATALLLLGCVSLNSGAALAQESYPSRLVKIIVPYDPGTGPDILARTLGQKLGEKWNVPLIVENRPGASTNIGTELAAKSPADGYTMLVTANTFVLNQSLFKVLRYDPVKDFAPVLPLALGRLTLVTHPSLQATSAGELIRLAKASPGKINYASPGNGTPHHLAMELFKQTTGVDLMHIPYRTTGGAVQDLLGGRISVMFLPIHVALPQIEGKKLNVLAAGGTKRAAATPQVPSLAEAIGVADIDVDIWYGLYAPAGTPQAIVTRFNSEVNALLSAPDVREALARQGLSPTGGTPEDLAVVTKTDLDRWAKVVRAAKIQAD
ncbi:MAG: tripartite tricarboxylate transporter substrate binding protein [Xanthobacteraceae bacterium]|nr:tripartite tricarboxylate transporter substrate binding protein [Xanthobacteraceae bacterium]